MRRVLQVSHDRQFINNVITDVIHFNDKKLTYYRGKNHSGRGVVCGLLRCSVCSQVITKHSRKRGRRISKPRSDPSSRRIKSDNTFRRCARDRGRSTSPHLAVLTSVSCSSSTSSVTTPSVPRSCNRVSKLCRAWKKLLMLETVVHCFSRVRLKLSNLSVVPVGRPHVAFLVPRTGAAARLCCPRNGYLVRCVLSSGKYSIFLNLCSICGRIAASDTMPRHPC